MPTKQKLDSKWNRHQCKGTGENQSGPKLCQGQLIGVKRWELVIFIFHVKI